MDANGLRFWLLADAAHLPARSHAAWDAECRALRLASERRLAAPVDPAAFAAAKTAFEGVPRALDLSSAVARWDPAAAAIVVRSHLPDDAVRLPLPETPSDLAVGPDGVLYVALGDRVLLHDLRGRWADEAVRLAGFAPWRIAADAGGLWVLERTRAAGAAHGLPLRARHRSATTMPPESSGPIQRTAGRRLSSSLERATWPAGERPIALAAHPAADSRCCRGSPTARPACAASTPTPKV